MKRKSDIRENPNYEMSDKKSRSSYMADPRLVPRVEQYLGNLSGRTNYVSLTSMAEDLQARYGEYGRKKKTAFRKSVAKAYDIVRSQEGYTPPLRPSDRKHLDKKRRKTGDDKNDSGESDSDASFSDENPAYIQHKDTNTMNSFMTSLYKKPKRAPGLNTDTPRTNPSSPQHVSSGNTTPMPGSPCRQSCPNSPRRWYEEDPVEQALFTIDRTGNSSLNVQPNGDLPEKASASHQTKLKSSNVSRSPAAKLKSSCQGASRSPLAKVKMSDLVDGKECTNERKRPGEKSDSMVEDKSNDPQKDDKDKDDMRAPRKVRKKSEKETKKKTPEVQQSTVKFADIGGNEGTLKEVCELLVHLKHPEVYQTLGVTPPRGFLLHGPPGCGKTLLANAIAGELDMPFIKMAATEIVSGVSGESEEKLRDVFDKALASAPCILFLDEIDAITQKRETASKDMERRIVSQLLTCMDDLNTKTTAHVLVIGATNRPDSLDPALRRAGRFDREISLGIPDEQARKRILQVLCRELRLTENFDFLSLARLTPGFVGADLMALAREAAISAVNRVFNDLQGGPDDDMKQGQPQQHSLPASVHADCKMDSQVTSPVTVPDVIDVDMTSQESSPVVQEQPTREATPSVVCCSHVDANETAPNAVTVATGAVCEKLSNDVVSLTMLHDDAIKSSPSIKVDSKNTCSSYEETLKDSRDPVVSSELAVASSESVVNVVHSQMAAKQSKVDQELNAVLHWLKEQPPLSEEQLRSLWITMEDFEAAVKVVQPSAKREGFATIPDVTWNDIGALQAVREELEMAIMAPVNHPEQFQALGLTNPPGVLLAGPPGCGKTLLAKAIANESGINFISVKGPELLNMYVGESERAVRQVFQRARNSSPCVVFFDELDALCPRRSGSGEGGSTVRVVNQLLTEMDGLEARKQVFIMGATNRPDIIDPAILRPGRLDKTLYVGLPTAEDRWDILKTITRCGTRPKLDAGVDLKAVADHVSCDGFTGADMAALVREAAVLALREFMSAPSGDRKEVIVCGRHFDTALTKIKPSVSKKDQLVYAKLKDKVQAS